MIQLLIAELLVLALWCLGIRLAAADGMILDGVDTWAEENLSEWTYKPIIGCVYCMASVHGSLIHLFFVWHFGQAIELWPIVCVCGVAGNGFAVVAYEFMEGGDK